MIFYVFDGSFEGLLTCVFEFYERKPNHARIVRTADYQPSMLDETLDVVSDEAKSKRVWDGLRKKLPQDWQKSFFSAYLSEQAEVMQQLFDFAVHIFNNSEGAYNDFGNASVIAISKIAKSVSRERHRMKAFIRFQETADGIFYAAVEPDYNVLPLVSNFFKARYADQRWIIYDTSRKYGLYYDLEKVEEIIFDFVPEIKRAGIYLPSEQQSGKEELYSLLWNDYFRSTNIPARRNMKLHIRHVPKRYWKYLTEKKHN